VYNRAGTDSGRCSSYYRRITLNSANRYAILYRLQEAKRPETRARRLEKFIAMLKAGETLH
jgi:uncharacterized protein YdeI (YjbR/CyaY-like superfamily)